MDSVKSFQARSHASGGCRKLKPGRTLKQAQGVDPFPLSALSPGAWPPDASYFDQANPMLRTEALGPAVARAQTIDRLRLGGPFLQQMERPLPELPTLDEAPGWTFPMALSFNCQWSSNPATAEQRTGFFSDLW